MKKISYVLIGKPKPSFILKSSTLVVVNSGARHASLNPCT